MKFQPSGLSWPILSHRDYLGSEPTGEWFLSEHTCKYTYEGPSRWLGKIHIIKEPFMGFRFFKWFIFGFVLFIWAEQQTDLNDSFPRCIQHPVLDLGKAKSWEHSLAFTLVAGTQLLELSSLQQPEAGLGLEAEARWIPGIPHGIRAAPAAA